MSAPDNVEATGGPAFPLDTGYGQTAGMTLRDYFACRFASTLVDRLFVACAEGDIAEAEIAEGLLYAVRGAYMTASIMLRVREEPLPSLPEAKP